MNAPVSIGDICTAEIQLLTGCHFDLLCFHPYKPVLALTEDLRTYLKSDKGKNLVTSAAVNGGGGEGDNTRDHHHHLLSGNDLLPIYDAAKLLLERVILSDIPLLYSPARVALAALMVGQEQVLAAWSANGQPSPAPPKIDFAGYLHQRFEDEIMIKQENKLETTTDGVNTLEPLCVMLRSLNEVSEPDLATLKNIHKKLKKVRWWQRSTKKKKKQAREESQVEGGDEPAEGPDNKRQKTK
jgi:cyclin H